MNRKESQQHSTVTEAIENKIRDAIDKADLVVYMNPSLPRFKVHIERSLMEQYGMDFAGALMLQAENNRQEVSKRGFNPETFAMIEGKSKQLQGRPVADLHYLWFKGNTFITTKELVPYDLI